MDDHWYVSIDQSPNDITKYYHDPSELQVERIKRAIPQEGDQESYYRVKFRKGFKLDLSIDDISKLQDGPKSLEEWFAKRHSQRTRASRLLLDSSDSESFQLSSEDRGSASLDSEEDEKDEDEIVTSQLVGRSKRRRIDDSDEMDLDFDDIMTSSRDMSVATDRSDESYEIRRSKEHNKRQYASKQANHEFHTGYPSDFIEIHYKFCLHCLKKTSSKLVPCQSCSNSYHVECVLSTLENKKGSLVRLSEGRRAWQCPKCLPTTSVNTLTHRCFITAKIGPNTASFSAMLKKQRELESVKGPPTKNSASHADGAPASGNNDSIMHPPSRNTQSIQPEIAQNVTSDKPSPAGNSKPAGDDVQTRTEQPTETPSLSQRSAPTEGSGTDVMRANSTISPRRDGATASDGQQHPKPQQIASDIISDVQTKKNGLNNPSRQNSASPEENHPGRLTDEEVLSERLNNIEKVMFRCRSCQRAALWDYLPRRDEDPRKSKQLYCESFECLDCHDLPEKVEKILCWRPIDPITTKVLLNHTLSQIFHREYTCKFEEFSYRDIEWVPGTWLHARYRQRKHNFDLLGLKPQPYAYDSFPSTYRDIDRVLEVLYDDEANERSEMNFENEEQELQAFDRISEMFVKWADLPYTDSTRETPKPADKSFQDSSRRAYGEYVRAQYVRIHPRLVPGSKIDSPFTELEIKEQPNFIQNGELMQYQLDGVNWIYYKWVSRDGKSGCILADEMGLGKTIQVIAALSVLKFRHDIQPFLIVVPNSTVYNWIREWNKWVPDLRAVCMSGSREQRDMIKAYEMCHENGALKAHVIVTSYASFAIEFSLFSKYEWGVVVVDEGQRLKNDESDISIQMRKLRCDFNVLLTGTPLQNNVRELLNLMSYVDPTNINSAELEKEYSEMDLEKIKELHSKLRPLTLRRIKADVLGKLPAKSEVIVPVSMSSLQKDLYKSIVSRNLALLANVRAPGSGGRPPRSSLSNILMQLRKVLSHPFVYEPEIEDRNMQQTQAMENLEHASSKLMLLKQILSKLHRGGHKVLIFCQFLGTLDILEDWLAFMEYKHRRIDGEVMSDIRQKNVDEFNGNQEIFCMILSTRAGGVGINLASADTVIILDPDFNPHQDIQAISRAHRMGQTRKVLVLSFLTLNTVEEKIFQMAKRKLVLDHLIIGNMEHKDEDKIDYESLLRFGVEALFEGDNSRDVHYDDASIEKLLERSFEKDELTEAETQSRKQFGFAKIWEHQGQETDGDNERQASKDFWVRTLEARRKSAMEEAARQQLDKRKRANINYSETAHLQIPSSTNQKVTELEEDDEFHVDESESPDTASEGVPEAVEGLGKIRELHPDSSNSNLVMQNPKRPLDSFSSTAAVSSTPFTQELGAIIPSQFRITSLTAELFSEGKGPHPVFDLQALGPNEPGFSRTMRYMINHANAFATHSSGVVPCKVCKCHHVRGICPIRHVPKEFCLLCGKPHLGSTPPNCAVLKNESVTLFDVALRYSSETSELKNYATRVLKSS